MCRQHVTGKLKQQASVHSVHIYMSQDGQSMCYTALCCRKVSAMLCSEGSFYTPVVCG